MLRGQQCTQSQSWRSVAALLLGRLTGQAQELRNLQQECKYLQKRKKGQGYVNPEF
jgi:hypothetical protein